MDYDKLIKNLKQAIKDVTLDLPTLKKVISIIMGACLTNNKNDQEVLRKLSDLIRNIKETVKVVNKLNEMEQSIEQLKE